MDNKDGLTTFGAFVRAKRMERGMTLRALAKQLNITAAYLSDIENGNRSAPKSRLNSLCEELGLTKDEQSTFFDLAAQTFGNQYEDINPYLGQSEGARIALRRARDAGLSDAWWQGIVTQIDAATKDSGRTEE